MVRLQRSGLCALSVLLIPAVGLAADASHCVTIADSAARLACYDTTYGRGAENSAPAAESASRAPADKPAAEAAGAAAATAITVDPVAEFGLSESQKRAQNPERAKDVAPESITETVATVGRTAAGGLLVTLESGQQWAQAETLTKARVAPGDEVTIRKATLGSYMMVAPNKVAVRVRRVR